MPFLDLLRYGSVNLAETLTEEKNALHFLDFLRYNITIKMNLQRSTEMENKFSVAISYKNSLGYVDYDGDTKAIAVTLGDAEGKRLAEEFLAKERVINVPHETLRDFTSETVVPNADVRSFQLAMTRLWEETGVHVDWSRPVDYVKEHPHY